MTTKTPGPRHGGCLCGHIRFSAGGAPSFPHLCSCRMCQRWSGAPTVAWVEFPLAELSWNGPGGAPTLHRSSAKSQRGFCPKCGGTLCALDDGYDKASLTIACFDDPNGFTLGKQHSFSEMAPGWWKVEIARPKAKAKAKAKAKRARAQPKSRRRRRG